MKDEEEDQGREGGEKEEEDKDAKDDPEGGEKDDWDEEGRGDDNGEQATGSRPPSANVAADNSRFCFTTCASPSPSPVTLTDAFTALSPQASIRCYRSFETSIRCT